MKKIFIILFIVTLLSLSSCTVVDDSRVKVIAPSGTPTLALATYAIENERRMEIVAGSDPLLAAFSKQTHDIIVAPVNLGAKMYQTFKSYCLYKTFVWGNLYIASKNQISSLSDLKDKTIVCFGKNSTPDIVMQTILMHNPDLNIKLEYVSDVSEANVLLTTNKAEFVVSAEPSLSKLVSKFNLSIIDLQEEWAKITNNASYPQAGIFVRIEKKDAVEIKEVLRQLSNSISMAISNPELTSSHAVNVHSSFKSLGIETLIKAIPNCNYQILDKEKEIVAVEFYFQMMIDLGFGKQIGGILPDEEFFY